MQHDDSNLNLFGDAPGPDLIPDIDTQYRTIIVDNVGVHDVGGRSSSDDDNALIGDQYIRSARTSGIAMPWETSLMRSIFGDLAPSASLSMPLDWGAIGIQFEDAQQSKVSEPIIPS